MSTRTERRVAILRALTLGIAEMFDDSETSEDGRGHLRANVETVLDLVIDAVYQDAAFDAAVVGANAMTSMLYATARTCYERGAVEAAVILQRMAAAAFQQQRTLFAEPRRGPLVDVITKFFEDYGPDGEMVPDEPVGAKGAMCTTGDHEDVPAVGDALSEQPDENRYPYCDECLTTLGRDYDARRWDEPSTGGADDE